MPIFPLLSIPADPDASHRVRYPGGYEWWRFEAFDPQRDLRFVISFHLGWGALPAYRRAMRRFSRRPTYSPPPLPGDYCGLQLIVMQGATIARSNIERCAAETVYASAAEPKVRMNGTRFEPDGENGLRIISRDRTCELLWNNARHAELIPQPDSPDHQTTMARLSDVEGQVSLDAKTVLPFRGVGLHDHGFGRRMVSDDFCSWFRARLVMKDRAYLCDCRQLRGAQRIGRRVIRCDRDGGQRLVMDESFSAASPLRRSPLAPQRIALADGIELARPRPLGLTRPSRQWIYEASGIEGNAAAIVETPG